MTEKYIVRLTAQEREALTALVNICSIPIACPRIRKIPLICMDEQPVQLVKETRPPQPAIASHPQRVDYEYERNGTATLFLFTAPLQGCRTVHVRARRTAVDWAGEIQDLLEVQYPEATWVRWVCDNLNTHKLGSLYDAFPPDTAWRLAQRLEIHYTPKHGGWRNIAESAS